jgi:hypothetical protein
MDALTTPVPAKLASSGGGDRPARCRGRRFRTSSHGVPVGFRVVSACQSPILLGRPGSPKERGGAERCWNRALLPVPKESQPSSPAPMSRSGPPSVFVQAWLSDRHPPHAHIWPCRRQGQRRSSVGMTTAFGLQGHGPVACRSGLPKQARARALAPVADTVCAPPRGLGARTLPVPFRRQASRSPPRHLGPVDPGPGPHAILRRAPDSTPSPRLDGTVLDPLQARGTNSMWRKRGVPSLSIEQTTQAYRRSTAWPQAGLRGRRLPRYRLPARTTERRSTGRQAPQSVTRAERAIETAPNPGISWRRRARSERRPVRALGRRANGTEGAGNDRGGPRGAPVPDGLRRARPAS